jgi:hypothetical protein
MEPPWLHGGVGYIGRVERFIPGQSDEMAAVVRFDTPFSFENVTAEIAVLELRYEGQTWSHAGTVHVELCDFDPPPVRWQDLKRGKWVESHASYEALS